MVCCFSHSSRAQIGSVDCAWCPTKRRAGELPRISASTALHLTTLSDQVLTYTTYVQSFMPLSKYIQTSCLPSPQYVEFTTASTGSILSSGSLEFQMDTNNPTLSP